VKRNLICLKRPEDAKPIDDGAPKQLTNFTTDQNAWFDLSRDGKPTLFSRGATTKDVVLISGFKK
jgi:hypothetical protein